MAEAVGLQVDVIPFSPMDDELLDRKGVKYSPSIDVVIRKKFGTSDLETVPGENQSRVKNVLVEGLEKLLEEIHRHLVAKRLDDGEVAWDESRILATYLPAHLRDKHQFTGVIRTTYSVVKDLAAS